MIKKNQPDPKKKLMMKTTKVSPSAPKKQLMMKTTKVTGPMPKTKAADPTKRTNVRTQENVARKNQGSLKK